MARRELDDLQLKVIEMLVEGEKNIVQICEDVQLSRSTFYHWKKHNKLFNQTLEEALEDRVKFMRQHIKTNAHRYIKTLEDIAENGKNENARVNAINKLVQLGELDPALKQDITVRHDNDEDKNELLDMLKTGNENDKNDE